MSLSKTKKYFLVFCVTIGVVLGSKGYAADIKPFLYLPFSYQYHRIFEVTEGWWYSGSPGYEVENGTGEYAIHGIAFHGSIDYALPYGTPVLAPMSGYLIASYHNAFLTKRGKFTLYEGVRLHYGLGRYVQIWNPDTNMFVILGHLSSIDSRLPISPPYAILNKDIIVRRQPTGVTLHTGQLLSMLQNPHTFPGIVAVKRGQRIGTVGVSGVEWDDTMPIALDLSRTPRYPQPLSWDEPHIHMEVFAVSGTQKLLRDPYAIYADYKTYPDSKTKVPVGTGTLFIQSEIGRIRYANEK